MYSNPNGLISSSNIDISQANNNKQSHAELIEQQQQHLLVNNLHSHSSHFDETPHLASLRMVDLHHVPYVSDSSSSSSLKKLQIMKQKRRDTNVNSDNNKNNLKNSIISVKSSSSTIALISNIKANSNNNAIGNNNQSNGYHKRRRRKRTPNANNGAHNQIDDEDDETDDPADDIDAEEEDYEEEETGNGDENIEGQQHDRLHDMTKLHIPFWDTFDAINQFYLDMGEYLFLVNIFRLSSSLG